jgi:hypothetical protein
VPLFQLPSVGDYHALLYECASNLPCICAAWLPRMLPRALHSLAPSVPSSVFMCWCEYHYTAVQAASPPHHRSRYVSTTPQLLIGVSLVVSTAKTPSFGAFSRQNFGLLEHLLFSIKAHVLANTLVAPREIHLDGHTFGFQTNDRFALVVGELRERFRARFAAPRLETPAWLAVRRGAPVEHLATADLAELLHTFSGTARSKHLVAKALTAVLTHHASWISTVLPLRLAWTDRQEAAGRVALRELYGVTPQLAEITRTVVVGKNAASVRQMLRVISFFLRCSRPCPLFPNESTAGDGGEGGDDCTVDSDSDGTPSCHDRPEPVATPVCDSPSDVTKLADFERVLLEPHDARAGATSGDVRSEVLAGSFGDVCCSLVPFLVLQGLTKMPTMKAVADDLCQHYSYSIVQCPIECARCIFIDIDKLSVDLVDVQRVSRDGGETDELTYHVEVLEQASLGVQRVLMGFLGCHDLMLPSQVCLEQLEGGLRELCIASETLALCNRPPLVEAPSLPPGIDASDVSLLEAIGRYTAQSESV